MALSRLIPVEGDPDDPPCHHPTIPSHLLKGAISLAGLPGKFSTVWAPGAAEVAPCGPRGDGRSQCLGGQSERQAVAK